MSKFRKYALTGAALCVLLIVLPGPGKAQLSYPASRQIPGQARPQSSPATTGTQPASLGSTASSGIPTSAANPGSSANPASAANFASSGNPASPGTQRALSPGSPASAEAHPPVPDTQPPSPDSAAFAFLDSVFHRPQVLYVTIGPDIPADMQPILIKFNNAIAANEAWFQDYRNRYANQAMPYDEHFGITAEQYYRVLRLQASPPPLVPIDSQTVTVIRDGSFIHFQCSGNEHLLNYLYIDPTHRVLEYGGDTIPFAGPASTGRKSPYGQWKGYTWHLDRVQSLAPAEDPLQPADPQKAPDPRMISARIIEVNIGIPAGASQKTFIRIQYQNLQAGIATANMELLGYIE